MIMKQKMNSVHLLQLKDQKNVRGWKWGCSGWIFDFLERERERLLSRFSANRIVGSQRSKK